MAQDGQDEGTRPRHTPGQAEGEEKKQEREDPIRRPRPGQAEGEDREDEADRAPKKD